MKTLRRIMGDAWFGGLLAAAISYILVFQSLAGAVVQGATAGYDADPSAIICSVSGDHLRDGNTSSPSEESDHHAFCAVLCQLAYGRTAALSGPAPVIQRFNLFDAVEATDGVLLPAKYRERPHVAEARAPPQQS